MKIIEIIIISTFSCLFLFSCQEDKQYVYKYYEDGSIHKKIEAIYDTVPHGEWVEYYQNGEVKLLTSFDSGYNEGLRREYYANGNIKSVLPMSKSKIQGFAKAFYANGNILWSGTYINGIRDGIFKEYYENDSGKILRERYFAFNPVINEENLYAGKEYDKNGNIINYERIVDLVSSLDTIKVGL